MRRVERHIAEEGLIFFGVFADKLLGVVRDDIRNEALRRILLSVSLENRIVVVVPVPRTEPDKLIKPLRIWMVRPLRSVVPFPKTSGRVAGLIPEQLSDRNLIAP